jgi:hypothetical protein
VTGTGAVCVVMAFAAGAAVVLAGRLVVALVALAMADLAALVTVDLLAAALAPDLVLDLDVTAGSEVAIDAVDLAVD